ncbi:MAG: hypothetical protein WCH76_05265 [Candidatus Riflemargulisbacteria bacterium]
MKNKLISFNEQNIIAILMTRTVEGDNASKEKLKELRFVGNNTFNELDNLLRESPLNSQLAPLYYRMKGELNVLTEYDLFSKMLYELSLNREHIKSYPNAKALVIAREITEQEKEGIELFAYDNGPGIPDILWCSEPKNSSTGLPWKGNGLSFITSAASSKNKGYAEIGTKYEKFLFGTTIDPKPLEPNITHGTLIRIVRFFK